jgi:hypothetical protein
VSSQGFKELAGYIRELSPDQKAALRQVAQQDPRLIWYSDVRFPRLVDQLELLGSLGGQRDLQKEKEIWGERMTDALVSDELVLMVAAPLDFFEYCMVAPRRLAERGRDMPQTHLWLAPKTGHPKQRFLVFGNRPPPWPEPDLPVKDPTKWRAEFAKEREAAAKMLAERRSSERPTPPLAPTSAPSSSPAPTSAPADPGAE